MYNVQGMYLRPRHERQILRYILKYLAFQPFSQLIPHQILVPFKTFDQSERRHNLTNQKTTFVLQPLSELIPYSTLLCFPPLHCCCSGGNLELGRAVDQWESSNRGCSTNLLQAEKSTATAVVYCFYSNLLQKSHDWPLIRRRISVPQCIESQAQGYLNT